MESSNYSLNSNTVAPQIVKTTTLLLTNLGGKEEGNHRSVNLLLKAETCC